MQGDTGPRSLVEKFFRTCLFLFGGVVLIVISIDLLLRFWVVLLVAVIGAAVVTGLILWLRHRRNTWL